MIKKNSHRPNVEGIMKGLKDFQRRSVEYVFRRFYLDEQTTDRFLVADEVGLGKTLVARGIIAKTLDHLWDKVPRLDVIYLCSNSDIARQNINRLNVTGNEDFAFTSRITLLPLEARNLAANGVNFLSFTPGTSLDLKYSTGMYKERALLYHLLKDEWGFGQRTGPINVLQCDAYKDNWRRHLDSEEYDDIDEALKEGFLQALRGRPEVCESFLELAERFRYHRMHIPPQDKTERNRLIGELRLTLAASCIKALEPDLIILDEFQRFKHLLDGVDQVGALAQRLFEYRDRNGKAKVLLLSATPYKMYTMSHETEEDDHYADFIRTVSFLFNSPQETEEFRQDLRTYRNAIYRLGTETDLVPLDEAKGRIEGRLRKVMIRTERLSGVAAADNMVIESPNGLGSLESADLAHFVAVDRVACLLQAGDHVEYWKSAPYLLNFMDNYELQRKLKDKMERPHADLSEVIAEAEQALLKKETITSYGEVDPANAKLRILIRNTLDTGDWKLLWVPPSLPYYQPAGAYAQMPGYTKSLVFSAWQVVPKVISTLCSYEAERRMMLAYRSDSTYDEDRGRRPLLRFEVSDGRPSAMPLLCLLYPSLTLGLRIDPLAIAGELSENGEPPQLERVFKVTREKIRGLLEQVDVSVSEGRIPDRRWYWAALGLLDRAYYLERARRLFEGEQPWQRMVDRRGEDEGDTDFAVHVEEFRQWLSTDEPRTLGTKPDDLLDVLTKIALASPAVAGLRSITRKAPTGSSAGTQKGAALIALGFRSLFNVPESMAIVRSIHDGEPYWERVLEYCLAGNVQSVLDEYAHILYESEGLFTKSPDKAPRLLAEAMNAALSIRTARLEFQEIVRDSNSNLLHTQSHGIRCRYAMRFGQQRNDGDGDATRGDQVRMAFNSPFRPFVLATTSVGQEGLDFHQYCHSLYHWNLPSNPVDLEQREGRIHRYKGHAIRRNLAKHYGIPRLSGKVMAPDPWLKLFAQASYEKLKGISDLYPYWVFNTNDGHKIERHVPALPLSSELERLRDLKQTLALYRMVFGQPNQEDLLAYLLEHLPQDKLVTRIDRRLHIDLKPY